ncbi:hypothetical protein [Massilia sp. ZL223]|uniref:hypothetical protein n=1 Tax=Massilia sp. ZL223 TaxID=2824904 RepID=UPI001B81F1B5|nr:hypothetical protein [Massilia sp. ZL223]MBQ5963168.1 hypothetical protein [Massilia sp. ZL223]
MQGQETKPQPLTDDAKIARKARTWRQFDKQFAANKTDSTRKAEYYARQQLREAIDTEGKR